MASKQMRLLAKAIIFLCLVIPANATTIVWDHDCDNADGFYVFRHDENIENPQLYVSIDCPSIQATVYDPGYYTVSAYNQNGYSVHSNTILLAQYYYNAIKIEYNSNGMILYRGEHTSYNAATDDPNWVIKRYYYDGQGRLIDIKIRTIPWDDRAVGW